MLQNCTWRSITWLLTSEHTMGYLIAFSMVRQIWSLANTGLIGEICKDCTLCNCLAIWRSIHLSRWGTKKLEFLWISSNRQLLRPMWLILVLVLHLLARTWLAWYMVFGKKYMDKDIAAMPNLAEFFSFSSLSWSPKIHSSYGCCRVHHWYTNGHYAI